MPLDERRRDTRYKKVVTLVLNDYRLVLAIVPVTHHVGAEEAAGPSDQGPGGHGAALRSRSEMMETSKGHSMPRWGSSQRNDLELSASKGELMRYVRELPSSRV
jgi:hypothetical protein